MKGEIKLYNSKGDLIRRATFNSRGERTLEITNWPHLFGAKKLFESECYYHIIPEIINPDSFDDNGINAGRFFDRRQRRKAKRLPA